jgi:Protein of unknown function (DUF1572)
MNPTDSEFAAEFIAAARRQLNSSLAKIKHCFDQLDDSHMGWRPFPEQNSITNLILHLCGNMRQWIIFAAAGGQDIRNRPAEFSQQTPLTKTDLLASLTSVITEADAVLATLPPEKLLEKRRLQGIDTTVLGAILDSVSHLVGHTHQIVYITRWHLREKYKFQWTPE